MKALPLVDVSVLLDPDAPAAACTEVGRQIDAACRDTGFLLVTGHGVDQGLRDDLERLAREFFALPDETKAEIAMARGGLAWRGWFPVGGELTSGRPDRKEGVYFGSELPPDDPRVVARTPLHGPNLFPVDPSGLRPVVLRWMERVTEVGQAVLGGIALGLGLERDWFARHLTADPTVLFRVFHYPPGDLSSWGVGEHTDYGLITLLAQDEHGGLQVRSGDEWVDVPADPYAFVVNIGDMLERMTRGGYRSNPHRVRNLSGADRLSFPLFLDPSWDATVTPLPQAAFRDRFLTGMRFIAEHEGSGLGVADAFDALSALERGETQWSYVFDTRAKVLHFRTSLGRERKVLALDRLDLSPGAPVLALDVNIDVAGPVDHRLRPLTRSVNDELVAAGFGLLTSEGLVEELSEDEQRSVQAAHERMRAASAQGWVRRRDP